MSDKFNQATAQEPAVEALNGNPGRSSATSHLRRLASHEFSFVMELLSSAGSGTAPAFPKGGDPSLMWEYVDRHGLGGLLGECADRVAGIPAPLRDTAQRRYWSNCLHGEQARQRCAIIMEAANRTGVNVCFVKGPALAEQVYGDAGLRGFCDIDLFTGSAQDARRLLRACGANILEDSAATSILGEIWDSGRLVAQLDGWTLELRFPIAGWTGPLFDLFPNQELPDLVSLPSGLVVPAVEWHFLFLLHHLMMHHFFGRLIWFLDLAALVRRERASLDWGMIVEGAQRLGISEALSATAEFCRQFVDSDFPEVPTSSSKPWNRAFIRHLVEPEVVVMSSRNKQQASLAKRYWSILHGASSYFLLADAPSPGSRSQGLGWRWTQARVQCVLVNRWNSSTGRALGSGLAALVPWFIFPLARALAWLPTRQQHS